MLPGRLDAAEAGDSTQQLGRVGRHHFTANFVEHVLTVAPFLDQPGAHEFSYMVRHGAFRNPRLRTQFLTRALAFLADRFQQRHPPGIGQGFGNRFKLTRRQHGLRVARGHCLTPIELPGRPVKGGWPLARGLLLSGSGHPARQQRFGANS
jgi:hypothetical protein